METILHRKYLTEKFASNSQIIFEDLKLLLLKYPLPHDTAKMFGKRLGFEEVILKIELVKINLKEKSRCLYETNTNPKASHYLSECAYRDLYSRINTKRDFDIVNHFLNDLVEEVMPSKCWRSYLPILKKNLTYLI